MTNSTEQNYLAGNNNEAAATIRRLLEAPVLLSQHHVLGKVLPTVLATIAAVTLVYMGALLFVDHQFKSNPKDKSIQTTSRRDKDRLAYQIANGVTNTCLGLAGIYFQYVVLPQSSSVSLEEKIQGHDEMYVLGSVQLGFQIWSIIMALFCVEESTQMLIHHVAVIFACSKSVFLTNGFRYYAPLALGMTELSSVPLSIMNSFKEHAAWRDAYPHSYLASRLIFSVVFLVVRIGLFVPQHVEYLKLSGLVTYVASSDERLLAYRVFMATAWVGAAFLLVLQLLWGYLIVKGLSNLCLSNIRIIKKQDSCSSSSSSSSSSLGVKKTN